jgi:aryl-alcohol dehydrogenase-like predicted oxidoreductase
MGYICVSGATETGYAWGNNPEHDDAVLPARSSGAWDSRHQTSQERDYIDLYWVHIWDQITPFEEAMRGLDDPVHQGKVHYVGIFDAPAWWIAQANTLRNCGDGRPWSGCRSSTA